MKSNYNLKYGTIIFLLFFLTQGFGQWVEDFSSNELSNWSGDVDKFRVNSEGQLQLDASEAGEAFIYRSSIIDFDTVSFALFHLMDFSPSDNNMSRIFLALDNTDPNVANGYFIEIGENGSGDALNFYHLESGVESFIGSASMGAMASEPAVVRLQIDIYPNGFWTIKTNYEGNIFTTLELEFMDDRFPLQESLFFGLQCTFSASRADKFFFDEMSVTQFEPDTTPPTLAEVVALNANQLLVTFSEPVERSEALSDTNYSLDNGIGNPVLVSEIGALGNQFQLTFSESFDARFSYILTIQNITDLNENILEQQIWPVFFADFPQPGDLFISELLFDPYPAGEDFVEIFNRSEKFINLAGLQIRNSENEEVTTISEVTITPGMYLAFSEDTTFLVQEYKPGPFSNLVLQDLPAFNNDEGNASLISHDGIVLDSFNYSEDQHFQLIDDVEGVSLERISFDVEATDFKNWQSAAERVRFATPGYSNSNGVLTITNTQNFMLETETFSPNQDGEDDRMILTYALEKPGFVLNLNIYDAAGHFVKALSNNELLGNQGIVTWDGTNDENQLADLGIYILAGTAFHPDGETLNLKLTTVLADFID